MDRQGHSTSNTDDLVKALMESDDFIKQFKPKQSSWFDEIDVISLPKKCLKARNKKKAARKSRRRNRGK